MTEQQQTHWYLVYTKARQEEVARQNLERQGYETYLPRIRQRRRRRGKAVSVIEAMFPRYLFIKLTSGIDNWGPIRSTLGVSNLVRFSHTAARVPDILITTLHQQEDSNGIQKLPDIKLEKGDRVQIIDGPLAGYEAIFAARSSKERVVVLLDIVGKHTRANVALSDLEISR